MTTEPAALLRGAGLRVTGPRVAVLTGLADHPHSDADRLGELARLSLGRISTQAVYDVLRALTGAGLVRRIEPAGSAALYELRVGDNHHHVVCRSCGTVADVDCAVGERPCLDASETHGFVIDEAEVVYWGTCPDCITEGADPRSPAVNGPETSRPETHQPATIQPATNHPATNHPATNHPATNHPATNSDPDLGARAARQESNRRV